MYFCIRFGERNAPDDFTCNMAIRRIIESLRVDAETKTMLGFRCIMGP